MSNPEPAVRIAPAAPMGSKTVVERAFELARGGDFSTVDDLRRALVGEGYGSVHNHFTGKTLVKQLRALMKPRPPA